MPSAQSIPPPPVGTVIDNGAIEFVDILGYGGYGIVFRAVDTATRTEQYAVKCLTHAQASRQRNLHMREIHLHRIASAHQGVVSLHRVIEDATFTYIVLDYYADGDLFTQILHKRTYLGYDNLIKRVFLQLLDAVEHCHSLGIYHRDLKPENVLCLEDGRRVAITDFGLATADKISTEFRTGSVYHMSPECHGPDKQHPAFGIASKGGYSPAANDVWSLGIILLNLATGRNPWKSATSSDPTFWAYLHDRANFLPTVLPISPELNALLVRTLDPIWTTRITLRELRNEVRKLHSVYADDVVFEHSMARCPWEAAMEPESPEESVAEMVEAVTPPAAAVVEAQTKPVLKVQVDEPQSPLEGDVPMAFANASDVEDESFLELADGIYVRSPVEQSPLVAAASTWSAHSSAPGAWRSLHRSPTPSPVSGNPAAWMRTASSGSSASDATPSLPPTPRFSETRFNPSMNLATIDTSINHNEAGPDSGLYSASSFFDTSMQTAVEFADDERSAIATSAPWTAMFHGTKEHKAGSPVVPFAYTSADVPMHAIADSDDELDDDTPCSPLAFRYIPRASGSSFGHEADVEDLMSAKASAHPASAPANVTTFKAFGTGRSFIAPRTSGASSSSSVSVGGCTGHIPRTPESGKTRAGRTVRSSGRFNPVKNVFRSLSPRRQGAAAASSSTSSGPRVSVSLSVELGLTRAQRSRPTPTRRHTGGKLGWIGQRLFGTHAYAS